MPVLPARQHAFPGGRRTLAGFVLFLSAALAVTLAVALATLPPPASAQQEVRLDDFERTYPPGETYGKWRVRKIAPLFGSGENQFFQFVHEGPERHYLHLKSGKNNSFSIGVEQEFLLPDWPILEWEWNAAVLPQGGDVRVKERDDQAGSICVIVDPGLTGFDSLCYLWENDGPKDTPITSRKREDSRYLILRTGKADGTGHWYKERRDILADYVRVFGRQPEEKAVIGIQIDSDSTNSSGEVFFRNIYRRKS
jgi:hypothetical protein